jgi:leucyl-tRNA synthetase
LHIGHIAGLLPGDVLARYHRGIGDKVDWRMQIIVWIKRDIGV